MLSVVALAGSIGAPALAQTYDAAILTARSVTGTTYPSQIVTTVNTLTPTTIVSNVDPAANAAIFSSFSMSRPTTLVSTLDSNTPTLIVSRINPAAGGSPQSPNTIVTTFNPTQSNVLTSTLSATTLNTLSANVRPISPNTVVSVMTAPDTIVSEINPPRTGGYIVSASIAQSNGSQIGAVSGQTSIRATRTFTETLSDRNEDTVTGAGTLVQPGTEALPAGTRSYAPGSAYEAYFPRGAVRPGPQAFTPKYKIYGTGFGGGFDDNTGLRGDFVGGLIGLDAQLLPNLIIGGAAGGSDSRSSSPALAASSDVSGFNGALYGIATKDAFYAQSVTTLSSFNNTTTRNVSAVGPFAAATEVATFGSFEVRERVEVGRVFTGKDLASLGEYKVVPFAAFEYANLRINGHSEVNALGTGTFANLTVGGQTITDLPVFIGARVERKFDLGNGMTLTPIVRLAYVHQFANAPVSASFASATGTTVFAANTTTLGRNAALTKAGAELGVRNNLIVFANFDGLFSGDTSLYGGRAGVRYAF